MTETCVLRVEEASGDTNSYNLKTSTACGDGTQPCDPRGLGLSPAMSAFWAKLPPGNDPTGGDGLNTVTLRGTVPNPLNNDFYMFRVHPNFTDTWRLDVLGRYFKQIQQNSNQHSLFSGTPEALSTSPQRQDMVSIGRQVRYVPR